MADALKKVRLQLINETTGEYIEDVDVKTSAGAVSFADGETLATKGAAWNAHVENGDIHIEKAKRDGLVSGISIENSTGVITITKYDGTTEQVDTLLEKVVTNFALGEDGESLDLTLEDGTVQNVSLSKFIDVYTGDSTSDTITTEVTADNKIKATVKNGSIGATQLTTEINTTIANKVDKAEGMGLSHNDFSDDYKNKLDNLSNYTLVAATSEKIGGVKSGGDIEVSTSGDVTVKKSDVRYGTGTYADGTRVNLMLKVEADA